YEAMRWGLPAITVDCGGPGWIVDESCGLKVPLTTPEIMPRDLALAIRRLAVEPVLRRRLGEGARAKIGAEALWAVKAERMLEHYADTVAQGRTGRSSALAEQRRVPVLRGPDTGSPSERGTRAAGRPRMRTRMKPPFPARRSGPRPPR